jgi:hypothetical protein
MSRFSKIIWLLMAFLLVSLTACGGGSQASPTTDPAMVYTQAFETAVAGLTQTAQAAPPATNTVAPVNTAAPEPTHTPLVTSANTPLPGAATATQFTLGTPKPTTQTSCNNLGFVADVTYPDDTIVAPGESIVKTWTVKNLGPCTWGAGYRIILAYDSCGASTRCFANFYPIAIGQIVNPGESIDLTVNLIAPTASGDYLAVFRLQTDEWQNIGDLANFGWFSIKVKVP